jgi:hypothetical protein
LGDFPEVNEAEFLKKPEATLRTVVESVTQMNPSKNFAMFLHECNVVGSMDGAHLSPQVTLEMQLSTLGIPFFSF